MVRCLYTFSWIFDYRIIVTIIISGLELNRISSFITQKFPATFNTGSYKEVLSVGSSLSSLSCFYNEAGWSSWLFRYLNLQQILRLILLSQTPFYPGMFPGQDLCVHSVMSSSELLDCCVHFSWWCFCFCSFSFSGHTKQWLIQIWKLP